MKKTGLSNGIAAGAGILILILDSKTALQGAREGINLCIQTVIPSLFPFFVFSIMLTGSLTGRSIPLLRPLGKLTGIPAGTESIFLTGLLGGYPVGAQSIASACKNGQLSRKDARRMMGFCSNAGPSFLFGIIGPVLGEFWMVWALWLIHILAAILVGILLPGKSDQALTSPQSASITLPDSLQAAIKSMASVCGWVVLFRVIIAFGNRWLFWAFPSWVQIVMSGILELTNGCCALGCIKDVGLRFVICSGLLSFGGLCVLMQTSSVASGVGLGYYFPGKLLQSGISIILSFFIQLALAHQVRVESKSVIILIAVVLLTVFCIFLTIQKNNCSIWAKHRV